MNRRDLTFLDSPQAIREYEASLASYTLTDLDEGYENPDPDTPNPGTTVPTVPTPVTVSADLGVALSCDRQASLTQRCDGLGCAGIRMELVIPDRAIQVE